MDSQQPPRRRFQRLDPAEQRNARFLAAQNELSPEQLELQRMQNEAWSDRQLAVTSLREQQTAKRWFLDEFVKFQYPNKDVTHCFNPESHNRQLPPISFFKEYARYLARSRIGRLSDKIHVKTLHHYVMVLFNTIQREGRYRPSELLDYRDQLGNFITNDLVGQEGLTTQAHEKTVAYSDDLTFILQSLYSAQYLKSFSTMRQVLNLNLYLVLLTDLCGRGSEIARHPLREEHMCLRWEDISFYSFMPDNNRDTNSLDIKATIKLKWSKGHTLDDSKHKTITFPGLLPTSLALQDSLRLLLILAIIDGVFEQELTTWDDLYRLTVPQSLAKTGQLIQLKASMKNLPVLRRMTTHRITNEPVQTVDIHPQIRRLGRFCGFKNRLVGYCLRRGVAYTLSSNTTTENRQFLMGHSRASSYWPYHSQVSTVDFPSMFRGLEQRSVLQLSSVSLARSDNAPQTISPQAMARIRQRPEIVELKDQIDEIRQTLIAKHRNLTAASRTSDPLWIDYVEGSRLLDNKLEKAERAEFQKEYDLHHERNVVQLQPLPADNLDTTTPQEAREGDNILQQIEDIDREDDIDAFEDGKDISDDEEGEDDDDDDDGAAIRKHGITTRRSRRGAYRIAYKGTSAYVDMLEELGQAEDTESKTAEVLMKWFRVCHAIDDFSPGEEPFPGQYKCRFCYQDLAQVHHAHEHVHACAKTNELGIQKILLDAICPLDRPCSYQKCGHGAQHLQFVPCAATFETHRQMGEHYRTHIRAMTKTLPDRTKELSCFFGSCASNPEGGRLNRGGPTFSTEEDRLAHMWEVHQVYTKWTANVEFCDYCHTWLSEPYEWPKHAYRHITEASEIIQQHGYSGVTTGRTLIPRICPFCFHNEAIPACQRVYCHERQGYLFHIGVHVVDMDKTNTTSKCPCFPAFCTFGEEMNSSEMGLHLKDVHHIKWVRRNR